MSRRETRLAKLNVAAKPKGRMFTLFRWSSQDPEEARRRWVEVRTDVTLQPEDTLFHVVFIDSDGSRADDWSRFERSVLGGPGRRYIDERGPELKGIEVRFGREAGERHPDLPA